MQESPSLTDEEQRLLALALAQFTPDLLYRLATLLADVRRAGYGQITISVEAGRVHTYSCTISEKYHEQRN